MPKAGQLGLIGRRAWKTWQVVIIVAIGLGLGLWWNYKPVGGSSEKTGQSAYQLPTGGSSTATTTPATQSNGSTTTTTSAGTTGTTTAGSSTTGTTVPQRVLLAAHQQTGNWTSTSFTTTTAGWVIGWAFACSPAPTSGPSLQIFITPVGGSASGTPAITESGASGQEGTQNETFQSAVGTQQLIVEAPAQCQWAVKVSGN